MRGGIGDHQRSEFFLVCCRFVTEIIQVHVPVFITGDDDYPHSCHDGTGRVGAVRRRRNETNVPVTLTVGFVKGANAEQTGVFSLRTGVGLQGDGVEPRDFAQHVLELLKELLVALRLLKRCEGVQVSEIPDRARLQLGRRIEFHRA